MQELLNEIEIRLRKIIREEIASALISASDTLKGQAVNPIAKSKLLTASEVAEILQISVQRVYSLARRSKTNGFPVLRIGDLRRILSVDSGVVALNRGAYRGRVLC